MSSDLLAVLVPLTSAVLASVVSWVTSLALRRQERHKSYSQIVTNDRIAWIKLMREITAQLLAICESKTTLTQTELDEFNLIKNKIKIHLNVKYEEDKRVCDILSGSFADVKRDSDELMKILMTMFNHEWHKIREEAGEDKILKKKAAKIYEQI